MKLSIIVAALALVAGPAVSQEPIDGPKPLADGGTAYKVTLYDGSTLKKADSDTVCLASNGAAWLKKTPDIPGAWFQNGNRVWVVITTLDGAVNISASGEFYTTNKITGTYVRTLGSVWLPGLFYGKETNYSKHCT